MYFPNEELFGTPESSKTQGSRLNGTYHQTISKYMLDLRHLRVKTSALVWVGDGWCYIMTPVILPETNSLHLNICHSKKERIVLVTGPTTNPELVQKPEKPWMK